MYTAKLQQKVVSHSAKDLDATFFVYGKELEGVVVFKYTRRILAYDDEDTHAMCGNLRKGQPVWVLILRFSRAENASPRACGMFYKATVQYVLLFGSKAWCLYPCCAKKS